MSDKIKEYILCAAIWYKELDQLSPKWDTLLRPTNTDKGIVLCGFRHPHCMYQMIAITGKRSVEVECGEYTQGFLTSLNRFVNRKEAWIIAEKANQIKQQSGGHGTLYSEDLY